MLEPDIWTTSCKWFRSSRKERKTAKRKINKIRYARCQYLFISFALRALCTCECVHCEMDVWTFVTLNNDLYCKTLVWAVEGSKEKRKVAKCETIFDFIQIHSIAVNNASLTEKVADICIMWRHGESWETNKILYECEQKEIIVQKTYEKKNTFTVNDSYALQIWPKTNVAQIRWWLRSLLNLFVVQCSFAT